MTANGSGDTWLDGALQRLAQEGYLVTRDVSLLGHTYKAVAHRSKFQLTKFGNVDSFYVFSEFDSVDAGAVREFSAQAFQYAMLKKSCPLPRGFGEAVVCFAVCMVGGLDDATAEHVRNTVPAKHWAAMEIPVIYDRAGRKLCYFEKTPVWGAAYYKGFRTQIAKHLGAEPMA